MATMAGLLNHSLTATHALAAGGATPMAPSSDGANTSDTSTISANDFLTLLVTEMKNQDPTADTDPNEYINQLVQVNSLEQLISINQTLTTDAGSTGSTPTTGGSRAGQTATEITAQRTPAASGAAASQHSSVSPTSSARTAVVAPTGSGSSTAAAIQRFAQTAGARKTPGNLAIPADSLASHRVARALDGHIRAPVAAKRP